jgi:hypothetical protein
MLGENSEMGRSFFSLIFRHGYYIWREFTLGHVLRKILKYDKSFQAI